MSYDLLSLKIAKAKPTSNGCSTSLADYGTLVFRLGVFFFFAAKNSEDIKENSHRHLVGGKQQCEGRRQRREAPVCLFPRSERGLR
jgi:hypothetical protein